MLSDFDLAKQSNDPNVLPTMVRNEQNGVDTRNAVELVDERC